jgi:hypothetical protein
MSNLEERTSKNNDEFKKEQKYLSEIQEKVCNALMYEEFLLGTIDGAKEKLAENKVHLKDLLDDLCKLTNSINLRCLCGKAYETEKVNPVILPKPMASGCATPYGHPKL